MVKNSGIEWTDHTFNPWVGCTKISPACDHCYAEGWAKRTGGAALWQGERRRTSVANWRQPIKWNQAAAIAGTRMRVFCASLADVFDNQVPEEWRADLWALIYSTPHLDWQLLTKRPQNIANMLPAGWGDGWGNVLLGTTVEDMRQAALRLPHLLGVRCETLFVSNEPLLGPLDYTRIDVGKGLVLNALTGFYTFVQPCGIREAADRMSRVPTPVGQRIGWVIAGGESGPGARPMHPDWARSLRDQCQAAGVPFFFKQWGEWAPSDDPTHWVSQSQAAARPVGQGVWASESGMTRIGKKEAGSLLDGEAWKHMPAATSTAGNRYSRRSDGEAAP